MKNKFKFKIGQIVTINRNQSYEFWKIIKRFKGLSGQTRYECRSLTYDSLGNIEDFTEKQMHIPFSKF